MDAKKSTRDCPYCKEPIKADALKCKHCGSRVAPERPAHGGTCPYCKEAIHPEAIRCKHCHSSLNGQSAGGCGCGCGGRGSSGSAFSGASGAPASPSQMMRAGRNFNTHGPLGLDTQRWPLECTSWCVGSTLVCECRVPGTIYGSIFPCGTCIDDPTILT